MSSERCRLPGPAGAAAPWGGTCGSGHHGCHQGGKSPEAQHQRRPEGRVGKARIVTRTGGDKAHALAPW